MICDACFGRGKVPWIIIKDGGVVVRTHERPCDDCGGSGISYCCGDAGAGIAEGGNSRPEHPSVFIIEEMVARGWDRWELARRMGGDHRQRCLEIDLYFEAGPGEPDLRIGDGEDFALAFGCPAEFFRNLEAAWLSWLRDRQPEPEG